MNQTPTTAQGTRCMEQNEKDQFVPKVGGPRPTLEDAGGSISKLGPLDMHWRSLNEPQPAAPTSTPVEGEGREAEIRAAHIRARQECMPFWTYEDDTESVGYLLARLTDARAVAESANQYAAGLQEEVARLRREAEGLQEEVSFYKQAPTASTLLIWCLRYLTTEGLEYVYDKLQRRCPLGKQHAAVLYPTAHHKPGEGQTDG